MKTSLSSFENSFLLAMWKSWHNWSLLRRLSRHCSTFCKRRNCICPVRKCRLWWASEKYFLIVIEFVCIDKWVEVFMKRSKLSLTVMRRKIFIRCESTAPPHIEVGRITVSDACAFRVSTSLKCHKLSKCTEGEDAHANTGLVVFGKDRLALREGTILTSRI